MMSRSAFAQLSILFFCLFLCFPTLSYAQVPAPDAKNDVELGRELWYNSIEDAMREPDKVYKLNLSDQKIKEFPTEVFNFPNLHMLNLSNNKIKEVPSDINRLPYLTMLNLYNNKIRILHSNMQDLSELRKLYLGRNKLVYAPAFMGGLGKLRHLDLTRNFVTPYELANLQYQLPKCNILPKP